MDVMSKPPRARSDALIVRDLDDETLVYDSQRSEAICMNGIAADVWRRCDGATPPHAIADAISAARGADVDERIVWLALAELKAKSLLEEPFELPPQVETEQGRRAFLRKLGLGAGLLLPIVSSIIVPTPAQAQSCLATGMVCTSHAQCCSSLCLINLVCA